MMQIRYLKTRLGVLRISLDGGILIGISFATQVFASKITNNKNQKNVDGHRMRLCKKQFKEYFLGRRESFDVSLKLNGTGFQKRVWRAIGRVPYGRTATYADIAKRAGRPKAVRAAANAVAHNPIAIVIPCHRIVRSNGELGGYQGGQRLKKSLLKLERNTQIFR